MKVLFALLLDTVDVLSVQEVGLYMSCLLKLAMLVLVVYSQVFAWLSCLISQESLKFSPTFIW